MRVMSYNIQHALGRTRNPEALVDLINLPAVAQVIAGQHADVVAIQEVDNGLMRSGGVNQANCLGNMLKMENKFCVSWSMNQDNNHIGEYGNALLSNCTVLDFQIHKLWQRQELLPGEASWVLEPRSCYTAIVADKRPICIMGLHLSTTADQRQRQLEDVASIIRQIGDMPIVLMGDFNADHQELAYSALSPLLINITTETVTATYPNGVAAQSAIDHIWVSRHWEVMAVWVVSERLGVSDHNPIVADLRLSG